MNVIYDLQGYGTWQAMSWVLGVSNMLLYISLSMDISSGPDKASYAMISKRERVHLDQLAVIYQYMVLQWVLFVVG